MTNRNIILAVVLLIIIAIAGFFAWQKTAPAENLNLDATPQNATLSGTYTCLPHVDTSGPQTMECAFGLKTDDGDYYAVNFGQSADAMNQFQSGAHITAEGFVVPKEALSSDNWAKYNMKGIFTITSMIDPAPAVSEQIQAKININAVCEGALAYMTFPDATSANAFVADCKAGNHPEVIEHYRAQLDLGTDAAI
jgi:hypothetical protein